MRSTDERLDEVDQSKHEMKQELMQMKAKAIAEGTKSSVGIEIDPTTAQQRSAAGTSAAQGDWRPRVCCIRSFAPDGKGDGHKLG